MPDDPQGLMARLERLYAMRARNDERHWALDAEISAEIADIRAQLDRIATPEQRRSWIRRHSKGLVIAPAALISTVREHPMTAAVVATALIGGTVVGGLRPWADEVSPPRPPVASRPAHPPAPPATHTPDHTPPPTPIQPSPRQLDGESDSGQPETGDQSRQDTVEDAAQDIGPTGPAEPPVRDVEPTPTPSPPTSDDGLDEPVVTCLLDVRVDPLLEVALLCR